MGRFQLSGTLSLAPQFLCKGVICLLAALWLMGQCCLKQMEINLGRKKIFFFLPVVGELFSFALILFKVFSNSQSFFYEVFPASFGSLLFLTCKLELISLLVLISDDFLCFRESASVGQ